MGKMLLHCCCGPCAMYPLDLLISKEQDLDCFWYNPNIQPQFEFDRRHVNLQKACDHYGVKLISVGTECMQEYWLSKSYLEEFSSRCEMCYDIRMDQVARFASDRMMTGVRNVSASFLAVITKRKHSSCVDGAMTILGASPGCA